VGQVTDSFWETQETNAEAAKFTFYQHEFVGETAHLNPAGKKKLLQVALRIPHVPFPIVVEQSENNRYPDKDEKRRRAIVEYLTRLGVPMSSNRVVVAPAFVPGLSAIEGEQAYRAHFFGGFRGFGGGGYGGGFR
jgi:hypothetical protein